MNINGLSVSLVFLCVLTACGGNSAPTNYTVGGTVSNLSGNGLVLEMNGNQDLAVGNGSFVFPKGLPSAAKFTVTIKTQPTQRFEVCQINTGGTVAFTFGGSIENKNIESLSVVCNTYLGYLYAGVGDVLQYVINSDGTLAPSPNYMLPGDHYLTNSSISLAISPDANFLYIGQGAFQDPASASAILVSPISPNTGILNRGPSALLRELDPFQLGLSQNGKFLFEVEMPADTSDASKMPDLATFAVNSLTGELTPAGQSIEFAHPVVPVFASTPNSQFLYVLALYNPEGNATLTAFSIDSTTGALSPGAVITLELPYQYHMAMDPLGRALYLSSPQTVQIFSINPVTGALSAGGSVSSAEGFGDSIAADPTGRYVYVSDVANSSVITLGVDSKAASISQLGTPLGIGDKFVSIICDLTGKYVYVEDIGPPTYMLPNGAPDPIGQTYIPYRLVLLTINTGADSPGQLTINGQRLVLGDAPATGIAITEVSQIGE